MISAWDPGDTTGYAAWDEAGNLLEMGQCPLEEIPQVWSRLENDHGKTTVAVVEDYKLFGHRAKSQIGSRMKAPQGIGMVKALAQVSGAEVELQMANIKDMAKKWFQITIPSDHAESHRYDAFLHGSYWLHLNRGLKTPLQLLKESENGKP